MQTTTHHATDADILIIGASGKTGQRVAQKLTQQNLSFRTAGRQTIPAFDWQQPGHWATCLAGVKTVYLTYSPDLAMPQAPADIQHFCDIAKSQNVEHIVLLSGRGEPEAQMCERIVQRSGMSWTVIRASWFLQNFTEGAFSPMVASGVIALPVAEVKEPFIDIDDIAEIAVKALTHSDLVNQVYEVTGPRLLSFSELASEISQITGQPMQFQFLPQADFSHHLREQKTPEDAIFMLEYLFQEVLDGRNAFTTPGVENALQRPATDPATAFQREFHARG